MALSNHSKRVYTAVALLIPTVLSVLYLPSSIFALLLLVAVALFAKEWVQLATLSEVATLSEASQVFHIILVFAICALLYLFSDIYPFLLIVCAVWWGIMLYTIAIFHLDLCQSSVLLRTILRYHLSITLPVAWFSLFTLHQSIHSIWVLYVIGLTIVCDIGAYYVGRYYGKTLICPDVSKGKTRAGVVGGLIASLLFALGFDQLTSSLQHKIEGIYPLFSFLDLILISLLLCLISIVGDLTASMVKRCAQTKESGSLLPGHGGLVDRLDSQVAVIPFFVLAWHYL